MVLEKTLVLARLVLFRHFWHQLEFDRFVAVLGSAQDLLVLLNILNFLVSFSHFPQ